MCDVQIVLVTSKPSKSPAVRNPFEIRDVDIVFVKNLLFWIAKIPSHHTDDANVRIEARGDGEMGRRATQHFFAFAKWRFDCVECHRTNYKERHDSFGFGFRVSRFRLRASSSGLGFGLRFRVILLNSWISDPGLGFILKVADEKWEMENLIDFSSLFACSTTYSLLLAALIGPPRACRSVSACL